MKPLRRYGTSSAHERTTPAEIRSCVPLAPTCLHLARPTAGRSRSHAVLGGSWGCHIGGPHGAGRHLTIAHRPADKETRAHLAATRRGGGRNAAVIHALRRNRRCRLPATGRWMMRGGFGAAPLGIAARVLLDSRRTCSHAHLFNRGDRAAKTCRTLMRLLLETSRSVQAAPGRRSTTRGAGGRQSRDGALDGVGSPLSFTSEGSKA